ncbi:MAG: arginine 2,3-aminomutase, partial [Bacteroidetes bacterium SW_7_64_58]
MAKADMRPGPDHPEWINWRWQMQNRIHSAEALREWIDPTDDERAAIKRAG